MQESLGNTHIKILIGLLKNGQPVKSADGRLVYPNECVGPSTPGSIVMLIDCPEISYVQDIVSNQTLKDFGTKSESLTIVHAVPEIILKSEKYITWMKMFGIHTHHVIANGACCDHTINFNSAAKLSNKLNFIDCDMFPLLYSSKALQSVTEVCPVENIVAAHPFLKVNLYPPNHQRIDKSQIITEIPTEHYHDEMKTLDVLDFQSKLHRYKQAVSTLGESRDTSDNYTLLFLGTGSAIPSKYRNVTGIFLRFETGYSMLFDCGEGSVGQLCRRFGPNQGNRIIQNLDCIFVSHIHADHHIGLIKLLSERSELAKESGKDAKPLVVIGPYLLNNWLNKVQHVIGPLNYTFMDSSNFVSGKEKIKPDSPWVESLETVAVPHCLESYGIVLRHKSGFSIAYSGDTKVSDDLVEAGKNVSVLIHDSTFEDGREEEASKKNHSTVSQAIDVGRRMGAKYTILTHFSQRYPKIPVVGDPTKESQVGVAFDMMELTPQTIVRLPHILPCVQAVFSQEEDTTNKSTDEI